MHIGIISNLLQQNTINNNKSLTNSLEKLSTGLRINKASNDASGLAISDKLRTQASGIKQGIENANSAIALTQIADKSMGEISNILDTVKAKLIQAHSNTTSEDGRVAIKKDIEKLLTQIESISAQTNYNGVTLLSHEGLEFQVGVKSSDIIPLKKININLDSLSGVGNSGIDYSKVDIADLQAYGYYINDTFDTGEVIFTKNDMLKSNHLAPPTNNVKDIVYNTLQISSGLLSPIHFEMEVNSSNFQMTHVVYENSGIERYSKFHIEIKDAYIIPEDEATKEYFERYFSHNTSGGTYLKDGNNGDLGFGYFDFYWTNKIHVPTIDQFINDEILKKNQILKFTIANNGLSGQVNTNFAENIQINNITANGFTDIKFSHGFYINPNDIHPNSPTIACGTLSDLKNMPHSSFTFDCAGGFQGVVDYALDVLNDYRGEVGSTQNQLESSVRNSMTSYVNLKNAESIIRDVDYAQESANFNKSNIIAQAGSFVLSQASQVEKNWVAQLLK